MSSKQQSQSQSDEDDEQFTEQTDVRVKWLGSALAFIVIVLFFGLVYAVSFGVASLDSLTASVVTIMALLVLAAGTWTFGVDLIDKYIGK